MIGRGMMKQPWIFQAIRDGKATDGYLTLPRLKDVITRIIELEQENARGSRYIDASKKYSLDAERTARCGSPQKQRI